MKIYKGLSLNGNAIIDGGSVMLASRDNNIKIFQNLDLNGRDIIELPIIIHGKYNGDIVADTFHLLNIGEFNNTILIPFSFKLHLNSIYCVGEKNQNTFVLRTTKRLRNSLFHHDETWRINITPYNVNKLDSRGVLSDGIHYFEFKFGEPETNVTCYINFFFKKKSCTASTKGNHRFLSVHRS